jgi:hypothetical protein
VDLALLQLAELLRIRNELDARISQVTGRSARPGDVGEFIASRVFDIELAATATQAGYDGRFRSRPLAGRTVDIKTYGDAFGGLGMSAHACEFYLILSGSRRAGGEVPRQRLHIGNVYLLDAQILRTGSRDVALSSASQRACGWRICAALRFTQQAVPMRCLP